MTESIDISRNLFSYVDETFVLTPEQPDVLTGSEFFPSDRVSPSMDEVYMPSRHDLDLKWKSVSVAHQPSILKVGHSYGYEKDQAPMLKRHTSSSGKSGSLKDRYFNSSYGAVTDIYGYPGPPEEKRAPVRPLMLFPTHFETTVPLNCIVPLIDRALQAFPEVSFESNPDDFLVSTSLLNLLYHSTHS